MSRLSAVLVSRAEHCLTDSKVNRILTLGLRNPLAGKHPRKRLHLPPCPLFCHALLTMHVYSSTHRFMASQNPDRSPAARPAARRLASDSPQHHRDDCDDHDGGAGLKPPQRAQNFQNGSPVERARGKPDASDAFETNDNSDAEDGIETARASIELDVLPIELVTLTDRCVLIPAALPISPQF